MNSRQQINTSAATLWASAFVIAALIIVQAGRLAGPTAYAEAVDNRGDYTLLTARSGRGPDEKPYEVLYVIDNRDQILMVYEIENVQRGEIIARDGGPLETLFTTARR